MYNALTIANYILNYYANKKKFITYPKLANLLYYLQVDFLCNSGTPLFCEPMMAVDNIGMAVIEVESIKSRFGYFNNLICVSEGKGYRQRTVEINPIQLPYKIKEEDRYLIDNVLDFFKSYSAYELGCRIVEDNPWKNAWMNKTEINNNEIIDFFQN